MLASDYQKATDDFAIYDKENAIDYLILGLVSEAGEVAGKMAKYYRGDYGDEPFPKLSEDVDKEIGDCLWMISQYCNETNTTIGALMEMNIAKLKDRRERGKIQGNGDER